MMQLGFVSAILPPLSLEEVFSTASDLGYDCVELMCWPVSKADRRHAGITYINAENLTDVKTAEVMQLAKRRIRLSNLHSNIGYEREA